ncbi:MAG: SDR family oxidoreductase [Planctomycetota bacterium]|nr:SDR family oxidoreductase [Planctomycetota bacterium]
MNLQGRISLVTGAARRLGREVALGLARRGSRVGVHYHRSEREAIELVGEIRKAGGEAEPFGADLRDAEACRRLIEMVATHFGTVDILVNNASTFIRTPLEEASEEDWDNLLSVNLKAPFFCSQAAGALMKKGGAGKIINLADVAALRPWKEYIPYSVAKAGLVALTKGLAKALAPEVQVNAIAPGTILPPEGTSVEEQERWARATPLGRLGKTSELVDAVLFLLEGGDFITGEVLSLDGGRHLV